MVQIKICGFTDKEDIEDAISLGIKIIGVNFYPRSPRCVTIEKAKYLLQYLQKEITGIGVFVNANEKTIYDTVSKINLSGIQLHGDESDSMIERFKRKFPGKIVIKAIRVKNREVLSREIEKYNPDYFILDAYISGLPGGTGEKIETSCLEKTLLPWNRIFIAGGITPENVGELLRKFKPYGIDVASGVESVPGRKDKEKIKRLLENLR